jgi:SAM-dependent methyltransferase
MQTGFRASVAAVAVSAFTLSACLAQPIPQPAASPSNKAGFEPQSGQAGKDVVWVPTPQALVDRMLDMAALTKDDYVIDLGSGDGRTVITAAKRGARAHGIEYNPDMVALAQRAAEAEGVAGRATFAQADIFESDFSTASLITLFLLPDLNVRLRPTLLKMRPGTRVVSNSFSMGDWQPDDTIDAGSGCVSWCQAHKWIVPAQVGGNWNLGDGTLRMTQTFQVLDGTLTSNGTTLPISEARVNGTAITFTAGGRRYTGEVDGPSITGSVEGGGQWRASRDPS